MCVCVSVCLCVHVLLVGARNEISCICGGGEGKVGSLKR